MNSRITVVLKRIFFQVKGFSRNGKRLAVSYKEHHGSSFLMELKLPTDSSEEYTELYGFDIYYECKEGERKYLTL